MIRGIKSELQRRWQSRLGRESFYSLLCGVVYALSQWLLLKVIFVFLGTETGGWYAYAMALITPVMSFGSFGLRPILATDAANQYTFAEYFSFRVVSIGVACAAAVFGYEYLAHPANLSASWSGAFVALALYRGMEWMSDLAQGEYQRQGRVRIVLRTYLFKVFFGLGAFAAAVALFHNVTVGFIAMAAVAGVVLAGYELRFHRIEVAVRPVAHWATMKRIATLAAPVGLILLLIALQNSIPRYLLERHGSLRLLGIFGAISYLGVFGGFLSTAISNAMAPILSEYWAKRSLSRFRRLLLGVLLLDGVVALVLTLAFVLFGRALLAILFNPEVAEYSRYLPLVALIGLAGFWDSHLGCGLTVLRRFKTQLLVQAIRIVVVTPIAWLLVRDEGLTGALVACAAYPLLSAIPLGAIIVSEYRRANTMATVLPAGTPGVNSGPASTTA